MAISAANKLKCANAVCSICKAESVDDLVLADVVKLQSEYETKVRKAESQGGSEFQKTDKLKMKLKYLANAVQIMEANDGILYTPEDKIREYREHVLTRHPKSPGGSESVYADAIKKRKRIFSNKDISELEGIYLKEEAITDRSDVLAPLTEYLTAINDETGFEAEEVNRGLLRDIKSRLNGSTFDEYQKALAATKRYYQQLAGTHEHSGDIQRKRDLADSWERTVAALKGKGITDELFGAVMDVAEWPELAEIIPIGKNIATAAEYESYIREAEISGLDDGEKYVALAFGLYGIKLESGEEQSRPEEIRAKSQKKEEYEAALRAQQVLNTAEEDLARLELLLESDFSGINENVIAFENAYKRAERDLQIAAEVANDSSTPKKLTALYNALAERFSKLVKSPRLAGVGIEKSVDGIVSEYGDMWESLMELQNYNNQLEDMSLQDMEDGYAGIKEYHQNLAPFIDKARTAVSEVNGMAHPYLCNQAFRENCNNLAQAVALYDNVTERHNALKNIRMEQEELEIPGEGFIFLELAVWLCIVCLSMRVAVINVIPNAYISKALAGLLTGMVVLPTAMQEIRYGRYCNIKAILIAAGAGIAGGYILVSKSLQASIFDVLIQKTDLVIIVMLAFATAMAGGRRLGDKLRKDYIAKKESCMCLPEQDTGSFRIKTKKQKMFDRVLSVSGCLLGIAGMMYSAYMLLIG